MEHVGNTLRAKRQPPGFSPVWNMPRTRSVAGIRRLVSVWQACGTTTNNTAPRMPVTRSRAGVFAGRGGELSATCTATAARRCRPARSSGHVSSIWLANYDCRMRPKSGLPKRRAIRAMPQYDYGLRENPKNERKRHPEVSSRSDAKFDVPLIPTVSLFAGCGGMDLGFLGGFEYRDQFYPAHPFSIKAAFDFDAKATETYRLNIGQEIHTQDLTEVDMTNLPPARLLMGGFPCQDFSSSGPKVGLEGNRGTLYRVLIDYMEEHRPEVVIAENVPHLARMRGGSVLATILEDLSEPGYVFHVWQLHCPAYGLPQSRTRLFIVGVRDDIAVRPSPPPVSHTEHRSIGWAIGDLEEIRDETVPNQSQYFVATKATAGAGQGDQTSERDKIAYAMRANPKARVHFHYYLERRLTVRECARIQSFPDDFVFPHSASSNIMQIGNAVPPIVGHAVADQIADFFRRLDDGDVGDLSANETAPARPQGALF